MLHRLRAVCGFVGDALLAARDLAELARQCAQRLGLLLGGLDRIVDRAAGFGRIAPEAGGLAADADDQLARIAVGAGGGAIGLLDVGCLRVVPVTAQCTEHRVAPREG